MNPNQPPAGDYSQYYAYDPNAYYYGAYQASSTDPAAYYPPAGPALPAHGPATPAPPLIGPMVPQAVGQASVGYHPYSYPFTSTTTGADAGDGKGKKPKKRKLLRAAGGEVWEDNTLEEWDENDFRLFAGDLGNDMTDQILASAFSKYPSFSKAKVVQDKRTGKNKGYGFISFKDPADYSKAWREMNGKYIGNRPIKLRKSNWKDRSVDVKRVKNGDVLRAPVRRK